MHFPCFDLLISVWLVSLWEDKATLNWYLCVALQYCSGLMNLQQPGCVQQQSQYVVTDPGAAMNQPHLTQGQRSIIYGTRVWWELYITPLKDVSQSKVLSVGFLGTFWAQWENAGVEELGLPCWDISITLGSPVLPHMQGETKTLPSMDKFCLILCIQTCRSVMFLASFCGQPCRQWFWKASSTDFAAHFVYTSKRWRKENKSKITVSLLFGGIEKERHSQWLSS